MKTLVRGGMDSLNIWFMIVIALCGFAGFFAYGVTVNVQTGFFLGTMYVVTFIPIRMSIYVLFDT